MTKRWIVFETFEKTFMAIFEMNQDWFDVIAMFLQKDTNGVVKLKVIPKQQSRSLPCEVR